MNTQGSQGIERANAADVAAAIRQFAPAARAGSAKAPSGRAEVLFEGLPGDRDAELQH